jgi:phosphonoacetate hydrolase
VGLVADCVVPSFTNPNNLSDRDRRAAQRARHLRQLPLYDVGSGTEVMMNDPKWLRAPTLLAALADAARPAPWSPPRTSCAAAGPQDEGHLLFVRKGRSGHPGENGITDVLALVGKPVPSVYSADLSEFVFAAGVKLMQTRRPDVMYLSTTDYIQHKHAPGTTGPMPSTP